MGKKKTTKAKKDETERPTEAEMARVNAEEALNPDDLADMPDVDDDAEASQAPPHVASIEDSPQKVSMLDMTPPANLASDPSARSIERVVEGRAVPAIVHPQIRGEICENCGVHYSQCKHYQGMEMRCSYCPPGRDTDIKQKTLFVYSLPANPHVLITCCEDYRCVDKHQKRFQQPTYQS